MKKPICICLFLIFSVLQAGHAKPLITIVRGQDFSPYHFADQTGKVSGFIIEMIQAAADDIDINVVFKQYPWSRCLQMVKIGTADAMMNIFKTKERKEFLYFSNNILINETNQFFKRKNSVFKFDGDLSALSAFKIGAIRNYSYGPEFDTAELDNIFRLETEKELIKSLIHNRCDAIIGNTIVLKMLVQKMGVNDIVESVSPFVSNEPLFIGFSKAKGHEKLSNDFSKALNRLKSSKAYKDILKKYNQ